MAEDSILPNRATQTVYLKDPEEPYGYRYIRRSAIGKFYCKVGKINTGLHDTPQLAAFVLHKLNEANYKYDLTDPTKGKMPRHPEAYVEVPGIPTKEIEYLRDPKYPSGWHRVKLHAPRGVRVFYFDGRVNGVHYRTARYPTPIEAAWAFHTKQYTFQTVAIEFEGLRKKLPALDYAAVAELEDPTVSTGFYSVYPTQGRFRGSLKFEGIYYYTDFYNQPIYAAWELLHMIKAIPEWTAAEAHARQATFNSATAVSAMQEEYRYAKALTAAKKVSVPKSKYTTIDAAAGDLTKDVEEIMATLDKVPEKGNIELPKGSQASSQGSQARSSVTLSFRRPAKPVENVPAET